jgi:hypothetical protein
LVHDDHQVPFLMMRQHLPEESYHLLRTDMARRKSSATSSIDTSRMVIV